MGIATHMFRFSSLGSLIALLACGTCVACSWQLPDEAHDPAQQQQHELNAAAPDQRTVTQSSCQHVREGDDVYVKTLRDGRWTGGWLPARVANVHSSGRLDLNRGHHPKGARIKPALASGIRRHHLRCDAANHKRKWHERRGERFGSAASSPKRCSKCGDMWRRVAAQLKRSPWYNLVRSAVCASKRNCATQKLRATENLRATRCLGGLRHFGHQVAKAARERQLGQGQSCKWKRNCTVRHGASKRCPFKKHCEPRVQERPFQKGDKVEVKVLDCNHARNCVHKGEWASAWVRAVNGNGASARFDLADAHGRAIEAALSTGIKAYHLRRPAVATAPSNETPDAQSASVVREVIEENPPRERGVREHDGKASEWANKDSTASELNRQSVAQLRSEMRRLGLECQAGCVEKSDLVAAIMKHREAHREAQGSVDKEEGKDEGHEANEDHDEDHEEESAAAEAEDEHHDLSLSEEGEGETDHVEDAAEEE